MPLELGTGREKHMAARPEGDRLDRDKIVRAALQLLDEVGLDKLSTRTLADWLGVKSPALYWHFKSKGALVDAMAEAMLGDASWPDPPAPGDDAAIWLADRGRAFRRALLAHRDGARVHAGTRPSPDQLSALNEQVAALTAAGFTPTDAARAALAVSRYTIGWVLEEQARAERPPTTGPAEGAKRTASADTVRAASTTDDLSAFPSLAAAQDVLEQRDPDKDFDFGLTALTAGLSAAAQATSERRP
jgi:TetR/AcrR family tetracycline transcriptional repressor